MALCQLARDLVIGGQLPVASLPGRLPALVVFTGGMLIGTLAAALLGFLPPASSARPSRRQLPARPARADPAPARQLRGVTPCAPSALPRVLAPRTPSLRVCVLGSLAVNGQAGALVPAQSQLIVALAMHSGGLSNRQLRSLLGVDRAHPKPADSLRQLIARTRRALGPAGDGREWIEHLGRGQYALHPDAEVDWREFDALTTAGLRQAEPGLLAGALELIRGQPFTGCYYWWLDTATVEAVNARIVAAAERLAELRLAGGDPAAAARAARIGLAADSAAEQLWRIVMQAEHAAGNLIGVREAWVRCVEVVSEIAAGGQPDSATTAVYDRLLAR